MSDSGTDSFVGVVIVLVIIVALVSAVNGDPQTSAPNSTTPSASTSPRVAALRPAATRKTPQASSNIPGGPLFACPGTVIDNNDGGSGSSAVNLKVYYSAAAGGRNCAVATKVGSATRRPGQLVVSLRFADSTSKSWPKFAEHRSSAAATRAGSVYLDDADNKCVRAQARFVPTDGGDPVSVSSGRTGCG